MGPRIIFCPNPRCQRKIEEPILLNVLSTTTAEQYYACPRCFTKVNVKLKGANIVGSFLTASGLIILAWICCFTIYETTMLGKDVILIFFGSRIGEAVSLGIGIKIIHYFVIGAALFLSGSFTFLPRRSKAFKPHPTVNQQQKEKGSSKCPYTFGYLKHLVLNNTPIPNECLRCPRVLECSSFEE
jgi:DNA-directed RNA polymerase subunit RPC12/RpoP